MIQLKHKRVNISHIGFLATIILLSHIDIGFADFISKIDLGNYILRFEEEHYMYKLSIKSKDGLEETESIDRFGKFTFNNFSPNEGTIIWWNKNKDKSSHFTIWPLKIRFNASGNMIGCFKFKKLDDIHIEQKDFFISDFEKCNYDDVLNRMNDITQLYSRNNTDLADNFWYAQLRDVGNLSSTQIDKTPRSQIKDNQIVFERSIRLQNITLLKQIASAFASEKNISDATILPKLYRTIVIELNNWIFFARQVYRYDQRCFPDKSVIDSINDHEEYFYKDEYKAMMIGDLGKVKELMNINCVRNFIYNEVNAKINTNTNLGPITSILVLDSLYKLSPEQMNLNHLASLFDILNRGDKGNSI